MDKKEFEIEIETGEDLSGYFFAVVQKPIWFSSWSNALSRRQALEELREELNAAIGEVDRMLNEEDS